MALAASVAFDEENSVEVQQSADSGYPPVNKQRVLTPLFAYRITVCGFARRSEKLFDKAHDSIMISK